MFLMWVLRFFVFRLYESPKYLVARGRDADAVEVVHKVAAYNGRTSALRLEHLQSVDESFASAKDPYGRKSGVDTSARAAIERKLEVFSADHVRALFATRKLAWNTSLLIILWGKHWFSLTKSILIKLLFFLPLALIGLAFPLYVIDSESCVLVLLTFSI